MVEYNIDPNIYYHPDHCDTASSICVLLGDLGEYWLGNILGLYDFKWWRWN